MSSHPALFLLHTRIHKQGDAGKAVEISSNGEAAFIQQVRGPFDRISLDGK